MLCVAAVTLKMMRRQAVCVTAAASTSKLPTDNALKTAVLHVAAETCKMTTRVQPTLITVPGVR